MPEDYATAGPSGANDGLGSSGLGAHWDAAIIDTAAKNGTATGLPGEDAPDGAAPPRDFGRESAPTKSQEGDADFPVAPDTGQPYSLELPEDILQQYPDLRMLSLSADDVRDHPVLGPLAKVGLEVAQRHGLTQAAVTDIAALIAWQNVAQQKAEHIELEKLLGEQMKALGSNGPARIDAVVRWLNAHLPERQARAMINNRMFTKDMIEGFETIIRALSGAGIPMPRPGDSPGGYGRDLDVLSSNSLTPGARIGLAMALSRGERQRRWM